MSLKFSRLTRPNIRKLYPGSKIIEHGIMFERLKNGDGRYTVNIMVDGRRIHRVIGKESEGITRKQAEDFIEKSKGDARTGRLNLPKGRKLVLGFREASAKYLSMLAQEGGKDLVAKRSRLDLHLVPYFGDKPLSMISSFDIERYKRERHQELSLRGGDRVSEQAREQGSSPSSKATPVSSGTLNRELAVLSHLFNKAVEWSWIDRRPAKVKRLKEENGRIIYLTVEQARNIVECAKADPNPQIYPFIVIGLETSMRMMEILSIRREHIDLRRRIIFVPKAKAGAREQPITARLAEFMAQYLTVLPKDQPWLFPSVTSKTGYTVNIVKPFRRVIAAAGLDPGQVVRHTLRHTAITHLVQAGVDLPTVKRISGHRTLAMVERYVHANGAHIQSAMDKFESRFALGFGSSEQKFSGRDYTGITQS